MSHSSDHKRGGPMGWGMENLRIKLPGVTKILTAFCIIIILTLPVLSIMSIKPVFAANVTLPFQDGFESGDFRYWSVNNTGGSVTSGSAHDGTYKAVFSSGYIQALFTAVDQCYMRAYVLLNTVPTGANTSIFGLFTSGTYMAEAMVINVSGTLKWELRYFDSNGTTWISHAVVSEQQKPILNTWYCVEVEGKSNSATNAESRMYVDGNELTDVARTGLNNTKQMTAGYIWISGSATVWYDNVVIATSYIGPETDMTPPAFSTITTNTTVAGNPCNFSCLISDDVNVSKYIFSTNNTGVWANDTAAGFSSFYGSKAAWANVTKTLNDIVGNVVSYMWYANDTSDNWSHSDQYNLTLTARVMLFEDGFESGNLSKWSSTSGATVTSGSSHHGTYKAVIASGQYTYKTLASYYDRLSMRAYVQFKSFPASGSESRIFGVWSTSLSRYMSEISIANVGGTLKWKLRYYDNGAYPTATSNQQTNPSLNTWHCVEVEGVSNSTTNAEARVYVNGNELTDITQTGKNNNAQMNSGYLQVTGSAISIWYDCVVIDTAYVGPECSLTVNVVGSGSVAKVPDQTVYYWGTNVTLTAALTVGWSFDHWGGDASGTVNPITVNMTNDKIVTATFIQNVYTLAVSIVGNGHVNLNNTGHYYYGDIVELTAVPIIGWSFQNWTDDLSGSTNPATILINGHKAVTANFIQIGPATIYVPSDYSTITQAIAHASAGDKILVDSGTYHEEVVMNKAVRILGSGASSTFIDGTGVTLTSPGLVKITAPGDVTFSGFSVRNAPGGPYDIFEILAQSSVADVTYTISNNNIYGTNDPDNDHDWGFYSSNDVANLVFTENMVTQTGCNNIVLELHTGTTEISHNTLDAGIWGTDAIYVMTYNGYDVTALQNVSYNTFNMGTGGPFDNDHHATAISFDTPGASWDPPLADAKFTNVFIEGNTINNLESYRRGIGFWNGGGAEGGVIAPLVKDNMITGLAGRTESYGMFFIGADATTNAEILSNQIYNCAYGIYLRTTNCAPGIQVIYNQISGNTVGLDNNVGSSDVEARYNYWGDPTGPYNTVTNPSGLGDPVSVNVDYKPYLTNLTPGLITDPESEICRKFGETFTVKINVTNARGAEDFRFEIHYNATLLDLASITWDAWGSGTYSVDEVNGILTGYTTGDATSGDATFLTITFNATYHHTWKDESQVTGWKNVQTGTVMIEKANLSYPSNPDLRYERGGIDEIGVGPDYAYTFSPIQGDLDNNGKVEIFDLRTIAALYGTTNPTYDLTGDGLIDIFDLVVVARNFGFMHS